MPAVNKEGREMGKNLTDGTNENTVLIDLDHGDSNRPLRLDELIQKASYDKLENQILSDLTTAQPLCEEGPDGYPAGNGFAYFIDGTRGAGKSTFLQSIVKALPEALERHRKRVIKLAYIDPSRVEDTEIVLLLILKALKKEIDNASRHHSLVDDAATSSFRKHFKDLAGGLSLFVPDHHPLKDLDPELFLDWGLERAGHSADLRKNLHLVIECACAILKVDALVLAFDDAEINGKHANDVLECVRKYLDTPRLLVFVTGDIELYALQLRGRFRNDIRGVSPNYEDKEREKQRSRMIDHLEDQYLLKLFPIRRRVHLRPIWNLLDQARLERRSISVEYRLTHHGWKEDRPLEEFVDELIKYGLRIGNNRDIALYKQFLLKQPLRSVLQTLTRCVDLLPIKDPYVISPITEALRESLRAVALGALYKRGVDVDGIVADELSALTEAVFDISVLEGDFDTSAYLRPQSNDLSIRNSTAALSADVLSFCNGKPAAVLQYMFTAAGSVALFGQVLTREERKTGTRTAEQEKSELLQQFKQYMGIGRNDSASNWARHATALLSPNKAKRKGAQVDFGVFALHRRSTKSSTAAQRTFSEVINRQIADGSPLPAIALSLIDTSGTTGRTFSSIYNVLGLIERLMSFQESEWTTSGISDFLHKNYPPLSISQPEWEDRPTSLEDAEVDKDNTSLDSDYDSLTHLFDLSEKIVTWLRHTRRLRRRIGLPAVVIGKIWTRLYFSLEKVSDNQRSKAKAATMMELFALCAINAFFVEESEHYLSYHSDEQEKFILDRTNPLASPKALSSKFLKSYVHRENLPLTAIVATCPLILGLLRKGNQHENYLVKLTEHPTPSGQPISQKRIMSMVHDTFHNDMKQAIQDALCDDEIFSQIDNVLVVGSDRNPNNHRTHPNI